MANDFTANPWAIDTAYSTVVSPGHITGSMVKAISVTWSDQVAAGDQVVIKDVNGKIIVDAKAQAANTAIILAVPSWTRGFLVPTLVSGRLSVTVQKG
jgi:hypothetical protein